MPLKQIVSAAFFAASLMAGTAAPAATTGPYAEQGFTASQLLGKPILVHVTAPWCPTCKQQYPLLSKLEQGAEYKDLMVYDVDFDSQKDVLRKMHVTSQSTLIVYQGGQEKIRSTDETDPVKIAGLLEQANK